MAILDDLLSNLPDDAAVRSVWVGAHWTAVCSRFCGLASTILSTCPHGNAIVRDAGSLHRKSAGQLAEYARSDNLLEAGIGVAAINSLLEVDESHAQDLNASEVLAQHGKDKTVALVGHFPFIPKLRSQVGRLWVIEQKPGEDEYPAEAAADLIPKAEVIAITGSALINHTLDGLLSLRPPHALVMVLGPSTPLSPILFRYGVDILSGVRITDENAVLLTIGQGASFRQVQGVRLVTLVRQGGIQPSCEEG